MNTSSLLNLLENHKVEIPIIQRDYAQGRTIGKVPIIRERFLSEIYKTLSNRDSEPLELDFIYGYTNVEENKDGKKVSYFVPLDGQQRLTTLFLLHWFFASKEGYSNKSREVLSKFTYTTRNSSRMFCEKLVSFNTEDWSTPIADTIIEQPWFFSAWRNDPTILSMLVMLDAIQNKFSDLKDIWTLLNGDNPKIVFHLLPMEKLGLPDDLYIKMNSRGKELTEFEYFKSQFSEILKPEHVEVFNNNIDTIWSDLFWSLFKDTPNGDIAKLVDSGFLSFFWYITDILAVKNNIDKRNFENHDFLIKLYANNDDNINFLFSSLNLFINDGKELYFESLFYIGEYEPGKCKLFFQNTKVNLFKKCSETYGYQGKANAFSISEQLMLYAIIINLLHNTNDFNNRIRKIRNLLISSEFQLRKEFLNYLYEDIERLVNGVEVLTDSKLSKAQVDEENEKAQFLIINTELTSVIHKLEDHHLLRGTISILDIDENITPYANSFNETFKTDCDYFEISQAMLTFGDYSQGYRKLKRFGNATHSTWRELFTPNEYRKNFSKTKIILNKLLTSSLENDEIISLYNTNFDDELSKPKDWRYYYIRYDNFKKWENIHQTEGYYSWHDLQNKPFEFYMLYRKQFNGRHWNPFLLELSYINSYCTIDNYGSKLQFTYKNIILLISMKNNAYVLSALDEDEPSKLLLKELIAFNRLNESTELIIKQNVDGLDLEDRIQVCNNFLIELSS